MSKLNFSKGKFNRFLSSKGFYAAVALCLVGAGAATWLAVERTLTDIGPTAASAPESQVFSVFPLAAEAEKKEDDIAVTAPAEPEEPSEPASPPSSSVSASQQEAQESQSEPATASEPSQVLGNLPALAYTLPISGNIINPYSNGELVKNLTLGDWRTHDGIDIAVERGVDVLAAADGVVKEVKNDQLWGTVITIDHPDGCQSIYSGLNSVVPIKEGERVIGKQAIGKVDAVPCEISDESHMHFAMKRDGAWIDPMTIIN
jgi:murein DD-endopeptidase MepM/ murein hydrolase activator NlpD